MKFSGVSSFVRCDLILSFTRSVFSEAISRVVCLHTSMGFRDYPSGWYFSSDWRSNSSWWKGE